MRNEENKTRGNEDNETRGNEKRGQRNERKCGKRKDSMRKTIEMSRVGEGRRWEEWRAGRKEGKAKEVSSQERRWRKVYGKWGERDKRGKVRERERTEE